MTKTEREVRENLGILDSIEKKLDVLRNEIIPYYGGDMTLSDLESSLWEQHARYSALVHSAFEQIL